MKGSDMNFYLTKYMNLLLNFSHIKGIKYFLRAVWLKLLSEHGLISLGPSSNLFSLKLLHGEQVTLVK